jgi:predicted membrane protein
MTDNIEQQPPRNGKALAGVVLLVVGAALLLRQFDAFFIPHWLFTWPMILIFIGLFIGAKSNFHKSSSFILIILGVIFLFTENLDNSGNVVWPLGIIAFGLWMILRRHNPAAEKEYWDKKKNKNKQKWDWQQYAGQAPDTAVPPIADYTYTEAPPQGSSSSSYQPTGDDYLDTVSVFGGVKKTVLSKDFKGGEIVNVFGGAEIDFMQADISGRVVVDITQIFGGIKIIVPSHWKVVSDIAAVFASVDDKRMKTTAPLDSNKILVLKGVSIFAGIDIRSF